MPAIRPHVVHWSTFHFKMSRHLFAGSSDEQEWLFSQLLPPLPPRTGLMAWVVTQRKSGAEMRPGPSLWEASTGWDSDLAGLSVHAWSSRTPWSKGNYNAGFRSLPVILAKSSVNCSIAFICTLNKTLYTTPGNYLNQQLFIRPFPVRLSWTPLQLPFQPHNSHLQICHRQQPSSRQRKNWIIFMQPTTW